MSNQPMKVSAQENSDSLRREAYTLIQQAFKVPEGFDDLSLNRFVDCVISAAVLQVAALQEKAAQQSAHPTPPSTEIILDSGVAYAKRMSKRARKAAGG